MHLQARLAEDAVFHFHSVVENPCGRKLPCLQEAEEPQLQARPREATVVLAKMNCLGNAVLTETDSQ